MTAAPARTRLRADLDRIEVVPADTQQWIPSPVAGVDRILLDREGDEVAMATSIVRYAPGSAFSPHRHERGEEFLVLSGVFSDETGDFPALTYVRNPPGTGHTPSSAEGCTIFVKLRQFAPDDLQPCVRGLDTTTPTSGWDEEVLHEFAGERVSFVRAAAGERVVFAASPHVREVLIVGGEADWQGDAIYPLAGGPQTYGWLRLKPGYPARVTTRTPVLMYTKTRPDFTGRWD